MVYFQEARAIIETALEARPDDFRLHTALGEALAGLNQPEEAVQSARRAIELMPASADAISGTFNVMDAVVRVAMPANNHDFALELLETYLAGPQWFSIEGLLPDPRFDPIRDDPRFQELVERYRRE